jgi:pimeloyl-ACP methyl ester carboxylesterase
MEVFEGWGWLVYTGGTSMKDGHRRRISFHFGQLALLLLLVAGLSTPSFPVGAVQPSAFLPTSGSTTRVSVASNGTQGNSDSSAASISADGRYIVFGSWAGNFVSGDTNNTFDVFVRDRATAITTRVSVSSNGSQGNKPSYGYAISANGRYIAFHSDATNLVVSDTNNQSDVFVHDRVTRITTRVSVASDGSQGNNYSESPSISADGRYVTFLSYASNFVIGDTNEENDVFIHDRVVQTTTLVSVSSDGTYGNNQSAGQAISSNGRYVVFASSSNNLVVGDTNNTRDVFVHDRVAHITTRVSLASNGSQGNSFSEFPSISADGRYVAFMSSASNLVGGDTNNYTDIFLHDRVAQTTTRVSVASNGSQGGNQSTSPAISGDGRYISFQYYGSDLVSGDTNNTFDILVHDQMVHTTTRVSVDSNGNQGNGESSGPALNFDGRYITFMSAASNLVSGDTNNSWDVFVRDQNTSPPQPLKRVVVLVHGWQGLMPSASGYTYQCDDWIRQYSPPEEPSDDTEFGRLAWRLAQDGYIVYLARWTTGWRSTMTVQKAARFCLAPQIQEVIEQQSYVGNPITKVTLVAHSMGGLVSRAYIEDPGVYQQNVDQLITFGTPHAGVVGLMHLLTLTLSRLETPTCSDDPGFCQLAADFVIKQFNTHYQPNATVRYDFVGGNATDLWNGDNAFANFMAATEGGNDGIVGRNSATGFTRFGQRTVYGSCVGRWYTGDAHSPGVDSPQHPAYVNSDDSIAKLVSFLQPGRPCPTTVQESNTLNTHVPTEDLNPMSFTIPITGMLTSNQTRTVPLWTDGITTQIALSWLGSPPSFTLTAPDGTLVTPENIGQVMPESTYTQQANPESLSLATYQILSPASGEWTATLSATAAITETKYVLLGAMESPLTLAVDRSSSVASGATFPITATLQNATVPITNATISASLVTDSGTISTSLSQTASGVYTTTFTAPAEDGQYQLIVRAHGPVGNAFSREDATLLTVRPNDIQRTAPASEQATDTNSNGLFEVLNVTVPLQVQRANSYEVLATLRTQSGVDIAQQRVSTNWAIGAQTLTLAFDGQTIRTSGLDGPYSISLEMVASDTLALVLDEQPLIQTAAYTADQFETSGQHMVYMPRVQR